MRGRKRRKEKLRGERAKEGKEEEEGKEKKDVEYLIQYGNMRVY